MSPPPGGLVAHPLKRLDPYREARIAGGPYGRVVYVNGSVLRDLGGVQLNGDGWQLAAVEQLLHERRLPPD